VTDYADLEKRLRAKGAWMRGSNALVNVAMPHRTHEAFGALLRRENDVALLLPRARIDLAVIVRHFAAARKHCVWFARHASSPDCAFAKR